MTTTTNTKYSKTEMNQKKKQKPNYKQKERTKENYTPTTIITKAQIKRKHNKKTLSKTINSNKSKHKNLK